MALNLTDQLAVSSGEISPPDTTTKLITLTQASALNFARDFAPNAKEIPTPTDVSPENEVLAYAYLSKMLSAIQKLYAAGSSGNESLLLVMSSLIAGNSVTRAQIEAAAQEDWETFINTYIENATEQFANVRNVEKAAYDAFV